MEFSEDVLKKYVGGQINIQYVRAGWSRRGEIKAIRIEGEGHKTKLVVELAWMARNNQLPPEPGRWVADDTKPYAAPLVIYEASDVIGNGRICLVSPIMGELTILHPKGGDALDKSKVQGL